jgi:hypothetical protein
VNTDFGGERRTLHVKAGLVPAIYVFACFNQGKKDVDARDKRGHDEQNNERIGVRRQ